MNIFRVWLLEIFIPFVARYRGYNQVLLLLDNASSHAVPDLPEDVRHWLRVEFFPAHCTSQMQPLDMGIIQTVKLRYKVAHQFLLVANLLEKLMIKQLISAFDHWEAAQARATTMKRGYAGLAEGSPANLFDVVVLLSSLWHELDPEIIARCWRKANILPEEPPKPSLPNITQSDICGEIADALKNLRIPGLDEGIAEGVSKVTPPPKEIVNDLSGILPRYSPNITPAELSDVVDSWLNVDDSSEVTTKYFFDCLEGLPGSDAEPSSPDEPPLELADLKDAHMQSLEYDATAAALRDSVIAWFHQRFPGTNASPLDMFATCLEYCRD